MKKSVTERSMYIDLNGNLTKRTQAAQMPTETKKCKFIKKLNQDSKFLSKKR